MKELCVYCLNDGRFLLVISNYATVALGLEWEKSELHLDNISFPPPLCWHYHSAHDVSRLRDLIKFSRRVRLLFFALHNSARLAGKVTFFSVFSFVVRRAWKSSIVSDRLRRTSNWTDGVSRDGERNSRNSAKEIESQLEDSDRSHSTRFRS